MKQNVYRYLTITKRLHIFLLQKLLKSVILLHTLNKSRLNLSLLPLLQKGISKLTIIWQAKMLKERIGFVGGGKMGEALIRGALRAKLSSAGKIIVSDVDKKRCQILEKETGIKTTQEIKSNIQF